MTSSPVTGPERRLLWIGVAVWVCVWIVLGLATALQIRKLSALTETTVQSGEALDTAGSALQTLDQLPIVGAPTKRLGDRVRAAANDIEEGGASSGEAIDWLSVLLGLSIVLVPVTSVLAARLPHHLTLRRDRRAVEEALVHPDRDAGFEEFLARRAVHNLPYDTLMQVTADPWADLRSGAFRRLANAELTRLGLSGPTAKDGSAERRGAQRPSG